MHRKSLTTRTTAALSAAHGLSLSTQALEREKTRYERQIAAEFATAISPRLDRKFELVPDPLPEADVRDAVLRDEHGVLQPIQLVEVRDVDRQRRLEHHDEPMSADVDHAALEQNLLHQIRVKSQKCASAKNDGPWLLVHSSDYPASVLMFASRSAREFLASNPPPFSIIWVFHSTTQADAGCIEQLWPPGSESDFVKAILSSDVPASAFRNHLWRGEEIVSLWKVRSSTSHP